MTKLEKGLIGIFGVFMLTPVILGEFARPALVWLRDAVASSPAYVGEPKGILTMSVGLLGIALIMKRSAVDTKSLVGANSKVELELWEAEPESYEEFEEIEEENDRKVA